MKARLFAILIPFILLSQSAFGQNPSLNGRFNGRHFTVDDFSSAGQIWSGMQGTDDLLYFGNNDEILCFNGFSWKHIQTSEKTPAKSLDAIKDTKVTSMLVGSDGVMYVGREDNFGYIAYNEYGDQRYYPLFVESPESGKGFGSVWGILELGNQELLFAGEHGLFSLKGKTVKRLPVPAGFEGYMSKTSARFGNGYIIAFHKEQQGSERLRKYIYLDILTGKQSELKLPQHVEIRNIRGSFEINGRWYLLDLLSSKFYSAKADANHKLVWNAPGEIIFPELNGLRPNYVYRKGDLIYLGTEDQGVIITNLQGKIVRRFDFSDELADVNVFRIFHDKEDNMWLCLNNGIQFFETSSPITWFRKNEGITSLTEGIDFNSGKLLIGLPGDVYEPVTKNAHTSFKSTEALKQDVYDIATFETDYGKRTLVVAYNGLYEYQTKTNRFDTIASIYGIKLAQDPDNRNTVYVTLDPGLAKLELQPDGKWKYSHLVSQEELKGGTFHLCVFKGKVYFGVSGQGVGIYDSRTGKFTLLSDKKLQQGEKKNYTVQQFQGEVYVGCEHLFYTISKDEKKFIPAPFNDQYFRNAKDMLVHRMINLNDEQLWLVMHRKTNNQRLKVTAGWLEKKGGQWNFVTWPLETLKNAGIISTIQQGPDNEIWLGASNGLFVLNLDAIKKARKATEVVIDEFEVNSKVLRYNVFRAKPLGDLTYAQNSFKVTFHTTTFHGLGSTEFRYRLIGFDDKWSEWSALNYASFQKIAEGDYTLEIQAKNAFGTESSILKYELRVLPPWYRSIWAYVLYILALIALIFTAIQISTQRVKRQNQKLEATVKERTSEIAEQNHKLEIQKAEIEAKNNDILDSIQYAKRIQSTILPTSTRLKELFHEHFVFYRPKDIVSGDFYWAREVQGKTLFSAIDCTGHGVPGSLVSIVGNNGLLRAVNEFKLTEPNEILDKLREIVVDAFRTESYLDVKDGMDIALCAIDYSTDILKYAGANNECVIIRGREIIELKPDKQPIGSFVEAKPFTGQEFELRDGDCIYLYTDGYVDQFGGEKGKKFKSRQFKTMLLNLHELSMSAQYDLVQKTFDEWMGNLEQVDDVCVMAVRYKSRK